MSQPDQIPPIPSETPANPYAAPQAEILATSPHTGSLASPWIRLAAQFVDGLTLLPVNLILTRLLLPNNDAAVQAAVARGDAAGAMAAASPPLYLALLSSLIAVAVLVAINWKFLPNGQTIGKKLLKIQIRSRDGGLLPVPTLLKKRMLPVYVVAIIPVIGLIAVVIDALCIFRPGRNTLHDDLAQSKVVVL